MEASREPPATVAMVDRRPAIGPTPFPPAPRRSVGRHITYALADDHVIDIVRAALAHAAEPTSGSSSSPRPRAARTGESSRDTKLNRHVAIKVLPNTVADNPLFRVPRATALGFGNRGYALSRDGQRFLVLQQEGPASSSPITVVIGPAAHGESKP